MSMDSELTQIKPLISVIITTFSRPEKLFRAIDSVLMQTFQDIEIIVVDDGSPLPVESLITKRYGKNVICLSHKENLGAPAARNTGIQNSNGKYIAFLDDDDEWSPNKLKKQLDFYLDDSENYGLIYCGYAYIYENEMVAEFYPTYRGNIFKNLLLTNFVGSSSLPLIKRQCLDTVGVFDEKFKSFQDWDMWLRVAEKFPVGCVDEILVYREAHGDQITGNLKKKIQGRESFITKYHKYLRSEKKILSHHYRKLADNYFLDNERNKGIAFCIMTFLVWPFSLFNLFNLVFVLLPNRIRQKILKARRVQRLGKITFYG